MRLFAHVAACTLLIVSSCAHEASPPTRPGCFACDELDAPPRARSLEVDPEAQPATPARSLGTAPLSFETVRLGSVGLPEAASRPGRSKRINLELVKAPFADAARLLGDVGGFNVVVEENTGGPVTVHLVGVDAYDALLAICEARAVSVRTRRGIVIVGGGSRSTHHAEDFTSR